MDGGKWLDEREQRAWRAYLAMQAELHRRLSRQLLAETGLSEADYGVLVQLSETPEGRLRVFELRTALGWEKTRLTHHLGRMARRGLLERQPCVTDPRGAFIEITEAGRAAIRNAAPLHVSHVRQWFVDVLSAEQLDQLTEIAGTIREALDRAGSAECEEAEAEAEADDGALCDGQPTP